MSRTGLAEVFCRAGSGARRRWPLAAVAAVFLGHCALFMSVPSFTGERFARWHLPLDDAWIHLAYAKNLLHYGYFTYNPGTVETGATSPLWVLLLAPLLAVLRQPVLAARVAGLGCGAACVGAGFVELRRAGGRAAAWSGALLLALDPLWVMGCLSGMEIPLAGLLLVLLIRQVRRGRPLRAGLAMGLLVLARPEMGLPAAAGGVLLLATLWRRNCGLRIADCGIKETGDRRQESGVDYEHDYELRLRARKKSAIRNPQSSIFKQVAVKGLCCAGVAWVVALPWFLYCRLGTGHWLPATFYVKAQSHLNLGRAHWATFLDMLEHYYWPSALVHDPVCLALLALGVGTALLGAWRRPALAGWLLFPLAHLAGWSMINGSGVIAGAHAGQYVTFAFTRYYLPDYPMMFGVMGLGAGVLARGVAGVGRRLQTGLAGAADRLVKGALAGVLVALLAAGNFFGWYTYTSGLWLLGDGYRKVWEQQAHYNVAACRNIYEIHERLGQWVAGHVPREATVATQDAGAIRYFAPQRLVDLWGLNSHEYLFAKDKAAYLHAQGVTVAAIFCAGRLDPLFDFGPGRVLARFSTLGNVISEEATMDVRAVK